MNASRLASTLCILFLLALAGPANAAQSYDNCTGFIDSVPATITTQGVWCLRSDLSTAITAGNAITIDTNNVTLDCNDFKLGGLAAGLNTGAYGIVANNRLNSVVRNCNIRGFLEGAAFFGGGGHVVEDSRFDGNTWIGIRINASNSTVRRNLVNDTGGSLNSFGAYGIVANSSAGGVHVMDNSVAGVFATAGEPSYGIWAPSLFDGSIGHNRVRGVVPGTGSDAVAVSAGGRTAAHDNILHGGNLPGTSGIVCGSNAASAYGNLVQGFAIAISSCLQSNNILNPN